MKAPSNGLSFSSVSTLEQCPYKWMRIYDGGDEGRIPRSHSPTAVEGSLVHDTLEIWHKDRSASWREILQEIATNKKNEFGDENERAYAALVSTQYDGACKLLETYMERSDIFADVVETELDFNYVLPNGVPIRGRIDRIDKNKDGTYNLVDYKTTRTYIWKSEVEQSLQGMMYILYAKSKYNLSASDFSFTIDALRFSPITVKFTEAQLQAAMDYLEIVYDTIDKTDAKDAAPRMNIYCGYCSVQDVCPLMLEIKKNGFDNVFDFEGNSMGNKPADYADRAYNYSIMETAAKKIKQQSESKLDGFLVEMGSRDETFGSYRVYYTTTRYGNPKLNIDKIKEEENEA